MYFKLFSERNFFMHSSTKETTSDLFLDISVIIPVMNEANSIIMLLKGLMIQSKKPKEIVIVDSGSVDGTLDNVLNFAPNLSDLNIHLTLLNNQGGLPGGNRNLGVTVARYEWIAFIDAGIVPSPDWLESLWLCMQKSRSKVIYGICKYDSESAFGKAVCAVSLGCGVCHPVLPASLFHRSVFTQVGYFREELRAAEDLLWINAVDKVYGARVICEHAIVFYNQFPCNLIAVAKKWSLYQKHIIIAGLISISTWCLFLYFIINIALIAFSPLVALASFIFYIICRGFIFPCVRSGGIFWWRGSAISVLFAPLIAFVIDVAKIVTLFFIFKNFKKFN